MDGIDGDSLGLDVHYTTTTMGVPPIPSSLRGRSDGSMVCGNLGIEAPTLHDTQKHKHVPFYRFLEGEVEAAYLSCRCSFTPLGFDTCLNSMDPTNKVINPSDRCR